MALHPVDRRQAPPVVLQPVGPAPCPGRIAGLGQHLRGGERSLPGVSRVPVGPEDRRGPVDLPEGESGLLPTADAGPREHHRRAGAVRRLPATDVDLAGLGREIDRRRVGIVEGDPGGLEEDGRPVVVSAGTPCRGRGPPELDHRVVAKPARRECAGSDQRGRAELGVGRVALDAPVERRHRRLQIAERHRHVGELAERVTTGRARAQLAVEACGRRKVRSRTGEIPVFEAQLAPVMAKPCHPWPIPHRRELFERPLEPIEVDRTAAGTEYDDRSNDLAACRLETGRSPLRGLDLAQGGLDTTVAGENARESSSRPHGEIGVRRSPGSVHRTAERRLGRRRPEVVLGEPPGVERDGTHASKPRCVGLGDHPFRQP